MVFFLPFNVNFSLKHVAAHVLSLANRFYRSQFYHSNFIGTFYDHFTPCFGESQAYPELLVPVLMSKILGSMCVAKSVNSTTKDSHNINTSRTVS